MTLPREAKGIAWSLSGKLASRAAGALVSLGMARLVTPREFGLVGMTAIFVAVASIIADCGFDEALVRRGRRTDLDYSTVFWFQNALGFSAYAALFVAAPLIAGFYGEPRLTAVVRAVALGIPAWTLSSVCYTRLRVEGRFGLIAMLTFLSLVFGGAVGLSLAYFLRAGVWAVVGQSLAGGVAYAALFWCAAGWRPGFRFSAATLAEFLRFGWKLLVVDLADNVHRHLFTSVIGRRFGAERTGLFGRASGCAAEPSGLVDSAVNEVVYPALAAVQDDPVRFRGRFLRSLGWTALSMTVVMALFAVFAETAVRLLLGENWLGCVPLLRVLAVGAVFEPLRSISLMPYYVRGRTDLALALDLGAKAVGFALLFAALPFGILALCAARSLGSCISAALNLMFVKALRP